MKTLSLPAMGSVFATADSCSFPRRSISSAPAAMTLGSSRGRITSWTGGPWRRSITFQVAAPGRPPAGA